MEDNGNNNALEEFRNHWRQELQGVQNEGETSESRNSDLDQAQALFMEGVELERKGKCLEAIRSYRLAVQIEPNIESKIYQLSQQQKLKDDAINNNNKASRSTSPDFDDENGDSCGEEAIDDLLELFQRDLTLNNKRICETSLGNNVLSTTTHISCLPVEVFLTILKWLVSNDLDLRSLERFGKVCKGFFLLSRDTELWRLACTKVWGNDVSMPISPSSWRDMFLNRMRVNFNGCYISRIIYQRYGESSFQDQFYRPVQTVEYFRLIRFLPNGQLIMMTSADELQTSINRLKNVQNAYQSRDILRGNYRYQDNYALIVIKKHQPLSKLKRRNIIEDRNALTFFLELEIQDTTRRKFSKLMWKHYSVSQFRNDGEFTSDFDLRSSSKYPPFFFSFVKSFHNESSECLSV